LRIYNYGGRIHMKKKIVRIFVCTLLITATVIPVAGNIKIEPTSSLMLIETSVDKISTYKIQSSPLTITATGPSDLDDVDLIYRWSDDNQSWAPMNILTFDDFEEGNFGNYTDGGADCSLYSGGEYAHSGTYAANIQDNSGDASSFYHTASIDVDTPGYVLIKIDFWFYSRGLNYGHDFFVEYYDGSSWEIVAQYIQGTDFENGDFYNKTVWIDENSYTFPSDMKIKFRCDAYNNYDDVYIDDIWVNATTQEAGGNGINWSLFSTDTSYPWVWYFNFPNNAGYYEFYSIGRKSGEDDETPPLDADTRCRFNRKPEIFNEKPSNGSTDVPIIPELNISISDADGDRMNITWYSNSSGTWQAFGSNINKKDGTYSLKNKNFSKFFTTYWWNVSTSDGIYTNSSPIFHFTTYENFPPNTPSNPDPEDGETDVNINAELSWIGDDPDGHNVTFDVYFGTTSSPPKVESNQSDTTYFPGILNFDTKYFWKIVAWDHPGGLSTSGPLWSFTTEENLPPHTPSNPSPENGATGVSINKVLIWAGGDPNEGDTVTYDVYFGTSSSPPLVARDLPQYAYDPGTMDLDTTYYWKIISEDRQGKTSTGPIWMFTTEKEPNEPPTAPDIYGPPSGPPEVELYWAFDSDDPEEHQIKYIIEWGDGTSTETDYSPIPAEASHTYEEEGEYTIKAKAEDEKGLVGQESTFEVTIKRTKIKSVYHSLLQRLFERFPNILPILRYLIYRINVK